MIDLENNQKIKKSQDVNNNIDDSSSKHDRFYFLYKLVFIKWIKLIMKISK